MVIVILVAVVLLAFVLNSNKKPMLTGSDGTSAGADGKPRLGCLQVVQRVGLFVAACIAVVVIYYSLQPKNVGYDDILTADNANTYVAHHTWSDGGFEYGNTEAAKRAISRLGDKAYGRKFGDLMDWEKNRHDQAVAAQEKARQTAAATQNQITSNEVTTKHIDISGEHFFAGTDVCSDELNHAYDEALAAATRDRKNASDDAKMGILIRQEAQLQESCGESPSNHEPYKNLREAGTDYQMLGIAEFYGVEDRWQKCIDDLERSDRILRLARPVAPSDDLRSMIDGNLADDAQLISKARKHITADTTATSGSTAAAIPSQARAPVGTDTAHTKDSGGRFLLASCGAVSDAKTGLIWLLGPDKNMAWDAAVTWAESEDACGRKWRLPSIHELATLYDPQLSAGTGYYAQGTHYPAHISSLFSAIGGGSWGWSSEAVDDDTARAYNFNQGVATQYAKSNVSYSTRAFAVAASP
jgi:hypothetical protein